MPFSTFKNTRYAFKTPFHTTSGAIFVALLLVAPAFAESRIATYNLLFYDSGASSRHPSLIMVMNAVDADVLVVEEVANTTAMNQFLSGVLNAPGGPGAGDPYVLASFTDTGSNLDIGLYYRSSRFTEISSGYFVIPSAAPRDARRWQLRPVEDGSGANDLYVYGMHLSATNSTERASQAADIRANANALPAGTHFIYTGDFNIDTTNEGAYQAFVGSQADNDGRAFDPLNPSNLTQNWSNNAAFAAIHTQSPFNDNSGAPNNAVGGGMDDRFDFMLISSSLHDSDGADYVVGSYTAFGNDGQHFNNDITDPPVIPQGAAIASALLASSDHLPVYLDIDFEIANPPMIGTPAFLPLPSILAGGASSALLTVQNTAVPPALDLEFSFAAPPNFIAPSGTFTLAAGASQQFTIIAFGVTSPIQSGNLVISNNSVNAPTRNVLLACEVRKHAVPSVIADAQDTSGELDFAEHEAGAFEDVAARVYNAGFAPGTSVPLEIYAASITGPDADRFSLVDFVPTAGISSFAEFLVHFDDAGAAPGSYEATLQFLTRDDSTLNGAMNLATISYDLSATVISGQQILGDFDMDGSVDLDDVDPMIALLLDPTGASPLHQLIGDMNQDETNDGRDLPLFADALLNP